MTETQARLLAWLASETCKKVNVRAVVVRIGKQQWEGARYNTVGVYTADMMACQRGDKKPGETYTEEMVYCIGSRPKVKRKTCFSNAADGLDWYVAGYIDSAKITEAFAEYHPFGASFTLHPWNIPGEIIDQYELIPYTRIPITITETS